MGEIASEWIVAGSSPNAPTWFENVRRDTPYARTITTNRGHLLFGDSRPDVYFLGGEIVIDLGPAAEFIQVGRDLQKRGSWIVGLQWPRAEIEKQGLAWFNEYLPVEVGHWGRWRFHPGKYTAASLAGLFCLQYAANNGAETIHLVGMEGYGRGEHYFDGGPRSKQVFTREIIEPFTQAVITACPGIEFVFYGDLNYRIGGHNVTHILDQIPCDSNSSGAGGGSDRATSPTSPTVPPTF